MSFARRKIRQCAQDAAFSKICAWAKRRACFERGASSHTHWSDDKRARFQVNRAQ
jgi:hypothetical protein